MMIDLKVNNMKVLKNVSKLCPAKVSKLCPEKYASENVLKNEKCRGKMSRKYQAKISGQHFWPEIKFLPPDELTLSVEGPRLGKVHDLC